MTYKFEPVEKASGWYWRLVAENGKIVGDGSEAYSTKQHLERAIESVIREVKEMPDEGEGGGSAKPIPLGGAGGGLGAGGAHISTP